MASLTDTAVMLGLSTSPVDPPASLKASLMAQIATTPQLQPVDEASNVTSIFSAPGTRGKTMAPAKRAWYARPSTILAAAAAVVAIFIGTNAVVYVNNNAQQSQQASSIGAISAAADSQRSGSPVTGGGTATLIWSDSLKQSAVVLSGLPSLAANKTYELWYISGKTITPAGTFVPGGDGKSVQVLKGKLTHGATVGITVEPAGGSKQPTTKPVVAIATA